jgi:hypothetical protein
VFAKTFKSLLQQNQHLTDNPTEHAFVRSWTMALKKSAPEGLQLFI